ncbi:MAG TPA: hypothetical protein VFE47_31560 [Tepidisphaeraceae bacterium]|jgi:hypothetical protein|nr:hypothetical protein [Tepidisphaeraceae bacterium]
MTRPQYSLFEVLENRTLMSAATLTQDEATLVNAQAQLAADKATSISVLAADRAAVRAHKPGSDPAVVPLINTWKQAILARANSLLADRTNLKTTTNTDKITVLQDRMDILTDKKDGNTTQLTADRMQLSADLVTLATDRSTLTSTLSSDVITTKATIAADHQAIISKRLADGADPEAVMLKQTLLDDSIKWVDTLAVDRRAVAADALVVAQDKHG